MCQTVRIPGQYTDARPCPYLAGHDRHTRPGIALARLSLVSGSVSVMGLFAHMADGAPTGGDYLGAGIRPDAPNGARLATWTRRTGDDATALLQRAGWRVVTVGEALPILDGYGYQVPTIADARTQYETAYTDEDPAGMWRPPLAPSARNHGQPVDMSAFVVPA